MPEQSSSQADEKQTYEDAVEELEGIIAQIESGEIGLEQSIRRYERGAVLLKRCRSILNEAEQRVTRLDAEALSDSGGGVDAAEAGA